MGGGMGGGMGMGGYQKRPFLLVSDMNGKVLDIHGGAAHPGTRVCVYHRKVGYNANQLWYMDPNGHIRSMLNEFALECRGQGEKVTMESFRGDPRQQWVFAGNRVVNQMFPGACLDIARMAQVDGAEVIAWPYKGTPNQHWHLEYM